MNGPYFDWLVNLVCTSSHMKSYISLLSELYETPFEYDERIAPNDIYRMDDGLALQYEYASITGDKISRFCSVLEVMIALARKCENISGVIDSSAWFWMMINNLGLEPMYERHYNAGYVKNIIARFLNRDYYPNGLGGLFYIPGIKEDLRQVEIWYQMCWYQNYILEKEGE